MNMPSYKYRKSHCRDKTILRPSYLHDGISYTGKMTSLYWIRALIAQYDLMLGYKQLHRYHWTNASHWYFIPLGKCCCHLHNIIVIRCKELIYSFKCGVFECWKLRLVWFVQHKLYNGEALVLAFPRVMPDVMKVVVHSVTQVRIRHADFIAIVEEMRVQMDSFCLVFIPSLVKVEQLPVVLGLPGV